MSIGIYRSVSQPIAKNSLVAVCLPTSIALWAKQRHYIGSGSCFGNTQPVLKKIVAVDGDEIQVTLQGVWINNKLLPHSKILFYDDQLRRLTSQLNIRKKLATNEIWLYGTDSFKSWDSRYYGAIQRCQVRDVMVPTWTWSKN